LVRKEAALYVKDSEAKQVLIAQAMDSVRQPELLSKLSTNIAQLAFTDSANVIAREVCALGEIHQKTEK
jgi:UDP-N-acetylglucosamine--N-acetylmuramyl-(pentapeptide) pyrophosphoryl-undecaprenol N-acetylglucosamine transferase